MQKTIFKRKSFRFILHSCMLGALMMLSACSGLFEGIYDEAANDPDSSTEVHTDSTHTVISGSIYIDASSWTDWYYIDFRAMADSAAAGNTTVQTFEPYPIPTTQATAADGKTGIYTYWYDVFGKGISVNEYRSYMGTDPQPEPDEWSFAVHRNNVRTNEGAAYETTLTDISLLDMDHEALGKLPFTADEWSENIVWTVQDQMLNCLIGSQGININYVLSSWLHVDLPPIPPAFTHNNHVFILKMKDGCYAAVQLENYQNQIGKKCCLTIKYKYPL